MPTKLGLKIKKSMFHRSVKELRKLGKENDIKLLRLWKYLKRRKVKDEKQNRVEKN